MSISVTTYLLARSSHRISIHPFFLYLSKSFPRSLLDKPGKYRRNASSIAPRSVELARVPGPSRSALAWVSRFVRPLLELLRRLTGTPSVGLRAGCASSAVIFVQISKPTASPRLRSFSTRFVRAAAHAHRTKSETPSHTLQPAFLSLYHPMCRVVRYHGATNIRHQAGACCQASWEGRENASKPWRTSRLSGACNEPRAICSHKKPKWDSDNCTGRGGGPGCPRGGATRFQGWGAAIGTRLSLGNCVQSSTSPLNHLKTLGPVTPNYSGSVAYLSSVLEHSSGVWRCGSHACLTCSVVRPRKRSWSAQPVTSCTMTASAARPALALGVIPRKLSSIN
jgi:hypothetical protein